MATRGSLWFVGRYAAVAISVVLGAALWALLHFASGNLLFNLEQRAGDWVWRVSAERKDERRLIVVDIDERSLRELGPWPWPRARQAQLLNQLTSAGVQLQAYDIVWPDPQANDALLAQAIAQQQAVLAQVFALEQGGQPAVGQLAGALDWQTCPAPFASANGYVANAASLQAPPVGHPLAAGHITPRITPDGVVRSLPAVICFDGRSYPALAIAAMMQGSGEHSWTLERGNGWLSPPWRLVAPNLASGAVPLDERGDLRVSWHLHPDSFISLSAADVLAQRVPPELFKNAWVLVGSSAFGLNDSIATPFGGAGAGLQVHAQTIAALIDGRTPYTPQSEPLLQVLAATFAVLLLVAVVLNRGRWSVVLLPVLGAGCALLFWLVHALALRYEAVWLGWADPAVFVLLTGTVMGIVAHAQSRIERNRLYSHLSSYLPAPVAASLALQPPSSAIAASTNQVSVLFADIRNFSAYCEARPPEEAAAVLHAFFSVASRVVQAHGGVIEAFQGDAVLAVWNGLPQADDPGTGHARTDHARRALQAAIELQAAMHGVLPDPAPAGLEPLSLGIGAETGPAMVGSFGLASRRTHMVMGRTVTIASRLVELTAELAHPILVGEGMAAQVGLAGLESMGTFLLEGMRVPHHIYAHPLLAAPHQP